MEDNFSAGSLLSFDKLIAPKVIKIVYFIGLIGIAIMGVLMIFGSFSMMSYSFGAAIGQLVLGIIGLAVGTLMWRIMMELYIALFGMYERLGEINAKLSAKTDGQ
jgi:hypothetical protein